MLSFQEVNTFGGGNTFLAFVFLGAAGFTSLIFLSFVLMYFVRVSGKPGFYEIENREW